MGHKNEQSSQRRNTNSWKQLKKCTKSLVSRAMQIKGVKRFHLTPIWNARLIKTNDSLCWWVYRVRKYSSIAGRSATVYKHHKYRYSASSGSGELVSLKISYTTLEHTQPRRVLHATLDIFAHSCLLLLYTY